MLKATLRSFWHYAQDALFKTVHWDEGRCSGCLTCYAVCPVVCFHPDPSSNKVFPPDRDRCVACGACVLQCPEDALALRQANSPRP